MTTLVKPQKEKYFKNPEIKILATEVNEGFRRVDNRIESMQRETNERFIRIDNRFESMQREMNVRFDAQQREINIRFENVDQKFSVVYWILGIGFTLMLSLQGVIMKFVIP